MSLLLLALLSAQSAAANESIELDMPITINGAVAGEITASVSLNGDAQLPSSRLRELLADQVKPSTLEQWLGQGQVSSQRLSIQTLRDRGLDIDYDSSDLRITIDLHTDKLSTIALRPDTPSDPSQADPAAEFAVGMNSRIRGRYDHRSDQDWLPLRADFDGFVSVGGFDGWALRYDLQFDEAAQRQWQRQEMTLLHDDYERAIRYELGDIRAPAFRFQNAFDLLGIGIQRRYADIQPFRNLRPRGRGQFILDRAADVIFEVNGTVVQRTSLEPGEYSVEDFPFVNGANAVRVLVDDGLGIQEVGRFSTYVDTSLLGAGTTNFGIHAGALRDPSRADRIEYSDDYALNAFWERGWNDQLTVGARTQLAEPLSALGVSAVLGSRSGIWAADLAWSKAEDRASATAATLAYEWRSRPRAGWSTEINAEGFYRAAGYQSLGGRPATSNEHGLQGRLSFRLQPISLSLSASRTSVNARDSRSVSALMNWSRGPLGISVGYQYRDQEAQRADHRGLLTITRALGRYQRLRFNHISDPSNSQLEWRRNSARNVGDIAARTALLNTDILRGLEADFGYIGSRSEFDIRHRYSDFDNPAASDAASSTVNLAWGMGFADGAWGVGRPFRSGFAIVDQHPSLEDRAVTVRRNSPNGTLLTDSAAGNVLLPLGSTYRSERLIYDVADLPLGYDLGASELAAFPSVHAGYRVTVGSDAANTVMGELHLPSGPLALRSGNLVPLSGDREPSAFFTNRTGRFVAEQLAPGEYRIVLDPNNQDIGRLTVPTGEPGLVNVGKLNLRTEP